jgi:hypothetical protein
MDVFLVRQVTLWHAATRFPARFMHVGGHLVTHLQSVRNKAYFGAGTCIGSGFCWKKERRDFRRVFPAVADYVLIADY